MKQRKRHALSVLAISMLALTGMMAVNAVSAQAQTHLWLVNGNNWSASTAIDALSVTGELLALGVQINCHAGVTGTLNTASTAHAAINFTKCVVLGNSFCEVLNVSTKIKVRFVLLELVIAEPLEGTEFAKLVFKDSGEELCTLVTAGQVETTYIVKGCATGTVTNVNDNLVIDLGKNSHCAGLFVGANEGILHDSVKVLTTAGGTVLAH